MDLYSLDHDIEMASVPEALDVILPYLLEENNIRELDQQHIDKFKLLIDKYESKISKKNEIEEYKN